MLAHDRRALLASQNQDFHYRVLIQITNPLRRTDRVAFNEQLDDTPSIFRRNVHAAKGSLVSLGIGALADLATKPPQTIAMEPKTTTRSVTELTINNSSRFLFVFCSGCHELIICLGGYAVNGTQTKKADP